MAEAIERRRRRRGRTLVADAEQAKAALWRRLFGADLSPAVVAAVCYVDVRERIVKITSGGWIRDEGDRILASGADPRVVAVLVEAVKGKNWKAVRIWGDEAFLREARRQFEAAGIPVTVIDPPPMSKVVPQPEPAEVVAVFRRRRDSAEASLDALCRPAKETAALVAARAAERETDDAWRKAFHRKEEARKASEGAESALQAAGLFGRRDARKRLLAAQERFKECDATFRAAVQAHEDALTKLRDQQDRYNRAESRRRALYADAERRARSDAEFAAECEKVAVEYPELARQGADAVEDTVRARLAPETAELDGPDVGAASDEEINSTPPPP